jgi:two-component system, NtrC family, nitrogen regulation response regulator NtrX
MKKILIVDDDPLIVNAVKDTLASEEYNFFKDNSGKNTISILENENIDLVLLDVYLGAMNGIEILKKIREYDDSINVIMISGESDIETALTAVRGGAYDFLEKPLSRNKLKITVRNAISGRDRRMEADRYRNQMLGNNTFGGNSRAILDVEKLIDKAAPTGISVFIIGENGTGKEIAARRIHYQSGRGAMPFYAINCATIPKELLESELFGHKKGSFTGAIADKNGIFITANCGTILLDEIGDMPVELQARLLRVLQEKEIMRIGDPRPIKIDVRIISATNRDIREMISTGRFREDLYYRLNGFEIPIPPLRDRKEDIPDLVKKFAAEISYECNLPLPELSAQAIEELKKYRFPGNVRELKNVVYRTLILNEGEIINSFNLPVLEDASTNIEQPGTLHEIKQMLLKNYLAERLEALNGDRKKLAAELGIHVNNLYRLI